MSSWSNSRDLFEYTSGRFLFNEELRLAERRIQFDVDALLHAVCRSTNRPVSDLCSVSKLAEGGLNRVLQTTYKDGYTVIARIPYRITVLKRLAVASEVATLDVLRRNGVPVPRVLGYSVDHANPVGAEYILLEKLEGQPLGQVWFSMDNKARVKIMKQIVAAENKFMHIAIPASGSLYYRRDLEQTQLCISLPDQADVSAADQIVVGPTAQHAWWYQERDSLEVDRGPWDSYLACFEAPAKREMEYCKRFGRPRLHVERYLRELYHFQEVSPTLHAELLSDYLKLAPYLEIPSDHPFARPTLRHPDFSPNNVLVDSSNNITGIIDWQHAVVLPLCLCAGIPDYFQNWGDPVSEVLAKPDTKLPEIFHGLGQDEQATIQETMRKRLVHFYYAALTMNQIPHHFDALRDESSMLRAKLFNRAGAPWEGDSQSLRYVMMQVCSKWPMPIDNGKSLGPIKCPVEYSEQAVLQCTKSHDQEQEKLQELTEMREVIGIDSLGWVPDDEHLEQSRSMAQNIKAGLLEQSESDTERTALLEHFPFDDHDEGLSTIDKMSTRSRF
ncbi:phosphotransferase family protein [Aspergillus sclerotioniger CBS 115572]|uniref:Phosphotransferase family protein n=1 Tax=Aspergillus sclerotioniger CBS 115572 TaxID=1450535 RepID=A0A317XAC9_9EURO|nr:phosphotransferase family protein [Aspergillus sclerotioniger CBS 115572]PWY95459.1 phosphotransferase family protein [Aspergillus sclerotioniger CBS 115572]